MIKYLKNISFFTIIVIFCFFTFSCSNSTKISSNPFEGTWIGRWEGIKSILFVTDSTWILKLASMDESYAGAYTYSNNSGKFIGNTQGFTGEAIVTGKTITLAVPLIGSMAGTRADTLNLNDRNINGTWIDSDSTEYEIKFDKGSWEDSLNGDPDSKGTYIIDKGKIISKLTHLWYESDSDSQPKWYTLDEFFTDFIKKDIPQESIEWIKENIKKSEMPRDCSVTKDELYIIGINGHIISYTRKN